MFHRIDIKNRKSYAYNREVLLPQFTRLNFVIIHM